MIPIEYASVARPSSRRCCLRNCYLEFWQAKILTLQRLLPIDLLRREVEAGVELFADDLLKSGPLGTRHLQIQALALESIGNGVMILDTDGTIQFSNRACHEMYGYTAEELFGNPFTILTPPEERSHSEQILKDSLDVGWHGEVIRANKNGERLQIDLTLDPIKDPDGNTIGFIGVGLEITARKLDEEERRRLSQENAGLRAMNTTATAMASG